MDSNFSYGDTRAPKVEASRASRVARAPERAMLAAGCTTVIAGAPSHRGFVQFASRHRDAVGAVRRVGGDRQAGPLGRRVFFRDVGGLLERRHPAPAGSIATTPAELHQ